MIRSDRVKVENEEGKYLSETILNARLKSHVLKQIHNFSPFAKASYCPIELGR